MNASAEQVTHKQSDQESISDQKESGGLATAQFTDNRTEANSFRNYQNIADNSPKSSQIAQLQEIAGKHITNSTSLIQQKENNTGLPDQLKSGMENLSGYSLDDVKVHYNSDKPAQLQAHAYAQGTDIHIASGQEKHLAHEAWHVVQQKQGRVQATKQLKGKTNINDDAVLEKEADVMGEKANHGIHSHLIQAKKTGNYIKSIVQRTEIADAIAILNEHQADYESVRPKFDDESAKIQKADPDGDAAIGMKHWSRETKRAAVREYNELHATIKEGGIDEGARLGKDNISESDAVTLKGAGLLEVKTNDTASASDVDSLVNDALLQLWKRDTKNIKNLTVYVYLENESNEWPYNASDGPKDFTASALSDRLLLRGVGYPAAPDYKVDFNVFYASSGKYVSFTGKLRGS